jgi:AAA15 family ATPase/GTPase
MLRYVSRMLWFRSLDENRYIGYKSKSNDYFDFIFEGNMIKELEAFLQKAGIKENLIAKKDVDGTKRLYFDTRVPLPFFKVASSGTKALYTFFYWYKTASDVSLMFIDEFDAFYHYELAETIVELLERMSGSQTILTSHNTNLLTNKIMRPDCYFILTGEKLTSFANATNRELREGHNLEKLYMSGEFNG